MCSNRKTRWRTEQSKNETELQQIKKIQAKNPVAQNQATGEHPVAKIYRALQTGEPLSAEKLQLGGTELKRLYTRKEALRIRTDGVLEIRLVINKKARWCIVCPSSIKKTVIWETHELAHSGMNRTVARLQLAWCSTGMVAEVRRLLPTCEVCQMAKPGGKVAIDLVGPMPRTQKGNQWILVLSDHFTRWQKAILLVDASVPTVATALDERIFCYFGLPEQLHSDLGKQFQSKLMAELCSLWPVDLMHTTPQDQRSSREKQESAWRRTQGSFTRQRTRRLGPGAASTVACFPQHTPDQHR